VPSWNCAFLGRVVSMMAEGRVRQFPDTGTGLPTANNTHQVAHRAAPQSRIAYVDSDPVVLVHARALTGTPEGVEISTVVASSECSFFASGPQRRGLSAFRRLSGVRATLRRG
jgi:hypothetical protein